MDARTHYRLGDFGAAEQAWRTGLAVLGRLLGTGAADRRDLAGSQTQLAMAVARQGRRQEADALIAPAVQYFRQQSSHNHGDRWLPMELAGALYVQALAEPGRRRALLAEASALMEGLVPQVRAARDAQEWRQRILEAQQNPNL
jgi:hypothetical protein